MFNNKIKDILLYGSIGMIASYTTFICGINNYKKMIKSQYYEDLLLYNYTNYINCENKKIEYIENNKVENLLNPNKINNISPQCNYYYNNYLKSYNNYKLYKHSYDFIYKYFI